MRTKRGDYCHCLASMREMPPAVKFSYERGSFIVLMARIKGTALRFAALAAVDMFA
jgi:hypothetical protein